MKQFSIFTICTENYADVLPITLPSWIAFDSVEKIFIYTNFDYEVDNPKVEVINMLDKTDDWLKIVGFKPLVLKHFLENYSTKNFSFIDVDCYIKSDISEVFSFDFDIAATRMNSKKTANSGVWFCKEGLGILNFSKKWSTLQSDYLRLKRGVVPHKQSYGQISFSDILHEEYEKNDTIKVLPIDENTYNCEADTFEVWVDKIKKYNPKIVHFKGRKWRDNKKMTINHKWIF